MDSRKAGGLFLVQVLISVGVTLWLSFGNPGFELEIIPNLILSQILLLVPALAALIVFREKPSRVISFRPIKVTTCLWIFLFTFLFTPLIVTVNAFSMIFSENAVMQVSDEVLKQPYLLMVSIMGILGPFSEEFVFRGVIFGSLRKSGRITAAILLQAFLFGLMHMNFNQFCYAFVIGIALGILVEVTGSLWAGFLMHASINASNVTMLYLLNPLLEKMGGTPEAENTTEMMVTAMCVYMVIALVTTSIAVCVLVAIAKNENGEGRLRGLLPAKKETLQQNFLIEPEKKKKIVSIWMVAASMICFLFMIITELFSRGLLIMPSAF